MVSYASPGHVVAGAAASSWGNKVSDSMDYLSATDRWKVTTVDAATNSFAASTAKVVSWELETYDPMNLHVVTAVTNQKIIITNPGLYHVRTWLGFAAASSGLGEGWIAKGPTGTTPGILTANIVAIDRRVMTFGSAFSAKVYVDDDVQCAAGDVLWVVGMQTSAGALAVPTAAYENSFSGQWIASS